jgi:N-acetyl-anhydromuramyl-L-alanine amidase AmpD
MVAAIMVAMTSAGGAAQAASVSARQQLFADAAAEFKVPQEVLLGISYNQSRWENHHGQPSAAGGFGLMHLTTDTGIIEDGRGDPQRPLIKRPTSSAPHTIDEAAGLLNVSAAAIKSDDRQNIRAAAALLTKYAKESNNNQLPKTVDDWYGAVARLSGMANDAQAQAFADDVYATIASGTTQVTTDGQTVNLPSRTNVHPNRNTFRRHHPAPNPNGLPTPECPPTITCKFVPARFAQNNPNDPTDYGNYDTANRPADMKINYIVIHDTEGSYQSAIDHFQDPASYVSAHYVIRSSDGEVTQMVKTKDTAWHAGNWYVNMHSVGVEHEGVAVEGASWYTEALYRSSAKLVRYLANKYNVPLDREHIVGHEQYYGPGPAQTADMHYDPGPFWNWEHYMELLQARPAKVGNPRDNSVTILPRFATNMPTVSQCFTGVCADLPKQSTSSIYLHTEPRDDAPLLTDAGLHPGGEPSTNRINDWGATAMYGERFAVAERRGDWTAVWFGGQKGWFNNPNPLQARTAVPTKSLLVKPKPGLVSAPLYGRPTPEPSAYHDGVPPLMLRPLQYSLPAGQSYVAYDTTAVNDYYQVLAFDRSIPGDGVVIVGNERYIPVSYNHREGFVKASDVDFVN